MERTEEEEVRSFLEALLEYVNGIGGDLSGMKETYLKAEKNFNTFADLEEDDRNRVMERLAGLMSLANTLWQGLKGVAGSTLRAVSKLLSYLLTRIQGLLIAFAKIFNIDSIVVTISLNPSIAITFKP